MDAWRRIVLPLLTAYTDAYKVATTRSSHKHAWDAAFTALYQKEMDLAVEDPLHAPRDPQEHAMRMARLRIGQPRPRADERFVIEAFCATISIRLTLARLAHSWLETCRTKVKDYPSENRRMWGSYVSFVYQTCREDGRIALELANKSESHRLKPKIVLLQMKAEFEQFRFNVEMTKLTGQYGIDKRQELTASAEKKEAQARQDKGNIEQLRYFRTQIAGQDGFQTVQNFTAAASALLEDWKGLIRSIRQDTFYQPVSREEMVDIVKAFSSIDSESSNGASEDAD